MDIVEKLRTPPIANVPTPALELFSEAADEIERLRDELERANNEFGSMTPEWPGLWERIAEIKKTSNDRWQEIERLNKRIDALYRAIDILKRGGSLVKEDDEREKLKGHIERLRTRLMVALDNFDKQRKAE